MDVAGIGGVGLGGGAAMSAGIGSGATVSTANHFGPASANSAPAPQTVSEYYEGALSPNLQELVNQLEGFNTAELLIALMILAAGRKDNDPKNQGASALDFLAGLSLSRGAAPAANYLQPIETSAVPSANLGGNLDVSA